MENITSRNCSKNGKHKKLKSITHLYYCENLTNSSRQASNRPKWQVGWKESTKFWSYPSQVAENISGLECERLVNWLLYCTYSLSSNIKKMCVDLSHRTTCHWVFTYKYKNKLKDSAQVFRYLHSRQISWLHTRRHFSLCCQVYAAPIHVCL